MIVAGNGIAIYGDLLFGPLSGVDVTGNHVANTGWQGILFLIGESATVTGNTVTGSGLDGLQLDQVLIATVADNTITGERIHSRRRWRTS